MIDPRLPGLATAIDDEAMRARLHEVLACRPVNGSRRVVRASHRVLKHTMGKRCVIAYHVDDGHRLIHLIGKVHRGARGALAFEKLADLWRLTRGASVSELGMPEPLAFLRDLGLVLQTAVPGAPLAAIPEALWPEAVARTAENLARLHAVSGARAEARTPAQHLAKLCRPAPEALVAEWPELEAPVGRVLARLAVVPADAGRCLIHGDLSISQVFVDPHRAWFVDFDGLCESYAAVDVANFLISIENRFGPTAGPLQSAFLERYAALARPGALQHLALHTALAWLRRASIASRGQAGEDRGWRVRRYVRLAELASRSESAAALEAEVG
jgi:hypothetical protein